MPLRIRAVFEELMQRLADACQEVYGSRLVTLAVFGSVGRGVPRPDSDIDLLIAAGPLPDGRLRRIAEFGVVERLLATDLAAARASGVMTRLSPVFKTPEEIIRGSLLFLDMLDDARILFDRDEFFGGALEDLRERLLRLGARRVWKGNAWYWDLKPDFEPGQVFEI